MTGKLLSSTYLKHSHLNQLHFPQLYLFKWDKPIPLSDLNVLMGRHPDLTGYQSDLTGHIPGLFNCPGCKITDFSADVEVFTGLSCRC